MQKKNLLIIIPARSRSKSIKNKNLISFKGKKLIEHSFLASKFINENSKEVFCSTDSKIIQKLAISKGIKSTPIRPYKISRDRSRDIEFVNHVIGIFSKERIFFKNGLILRPTNPNRTKTNLNLAYQKFLNSRKADSLKSIFPVEKTPFKTWIIKKDFLKIVAKVKSIKESFNAPRQILPETFNQTGTYEFFKINYKSKIKSISGKKITYFKVSKFESLDIDNINDLII